MSSISGFVNSQNQTSNSRVADDSFVDTSIGGASKGGLSHIVSFPSNVSSEIPPQLEAQIFGVLSASPMQGVELRGKLSANPGSGVSGVELGGKLSANLGGNSLESVELRGKLSTDPGDGARGLDLHDTTDTQPIFLDSNEDFFPNRTLSPIDSDASSDTLCPSDASSDTLCPSEVSEIDVERAEESVSNAKIKGFIRIQLGLGNDVPSRTLAIKEQTEQINLNNTLQKLVDIIRTEDGIDVWVGYDQDGDICIDTLTVYRKTGNQTEAHHYNLLARDEWIRLMSDNMAVIDEEFSKDTIETYITDHKQELDKIAEDLMRLMKKIDSEHRNSAHSMQSVYSFSGVRDPLQASFRVHRALKESHFIPNGLRKMFLCPDYKLVTPDGEFTERGSRAFKELLAAHHLIEGEKKHLKHRHSLLRIESSKPDIDDAEKIRIKREMDELAERFKEIQQYSKVACMIGIIQSHREVVLTSRGREGDVDVQPPESVSLREALMRADQEGALNGLGFEMGKVYYLSKCNIDAYKKERIAPDKTLRLLRRDGVEETVSREEFLRIAANKEQMMRYRSFSVHEEHLLDPVVIRKQLSLRIAQEFSDFLLEGDKRWYQVDSRMSKSYLDFRNVDPLSVQEKNVGMELGDMLFYKGITLANRANPYFRIINQLKYQDRQIPLAREISGINAIIPAASQLVDHIDQNSVSEEGGEEIYLDRFSKQAVETAERMIAELGKIDGQPLNRLIKSALLNKN